MSERDQTGMTSDEERVRASLQAAVPPVAEAEFRQRLKEDFVSGRIAERRPRAVPPRRHVRPWRRAAALAAAAAVTIVAGVLLNRGPAWQVAATSGTGVVQVDGQPIAIQQLSALRGRIRSGVELSLPAEGELEVALSRTLAIQLTPGTQLTLPPPPSRWIGRSIELYARAGELRIATGPALRGGRLEIRTPDAAIEVRGTTLAVIMESTGTCVCVLDGNVRLGRSGETMRVVSAGKRGYAFRDGRPLLIDEIRPMERSKLTMFRDARRAFLRLGGSE